MITHVSLTFFSWNIFQIYVCQLSISIIREHIYQIFDHYNHEDAC